VSEDSLDGFDRYIKDFIIWELQRIRPKWRLTKWEHDNPLNKDPLYLDSLELVELAGLLADRFHVRETGAEDYFLARKTPREWADLLRYTREQKVPSVTFASSGTTGDPKLYTHSWENLEREAAYFASLIPGRKRLIKTVPSHHIYGFLFSWLIPNVSGLRVIEQSPEAPAWEPGDLVVTVPFLLGIWLRRKVPIPKDVIFTISTAPFPKEMAEALHDAGASYYEIYGSSETAGIGFRAEPTSPFKLLPWWSMEVSSDIHTPRLRRDDGVVFDVPDEVDIPSPGYILPKKRRDGAIQVGGVNVFPSRVKSVLEQHPSVAQAAVRPTDDGTSVRLKAFIVPREGVDLRNEQELENSLREWAMQNLTPAERPSSYTFGASLPRSPLGKEADW
jgi:long-chain acyl-CoA synthetase